MLVRTLHGPVQVFVCEMKNRRPVSVLKGTVSGVAVDGSGIVSGGANVEAAV